MDTCPNTVQARIGALDWPALETALDARGAAVAHGLLDARECGELAALYAQPRLFRSRIVMARHGFGRGEYQYFAYPLPPLVAQLRTAFYPPLAAVANRWNAALRDPMRYPARHADWLHTCHQADQARPTPLLLKYGPGDYNCLHQDLYGERVFPLQVAILLSRPGRDFDGGEFVMTEQRSGHAARAEVMPLAQGDALVFAVNRRPAQGARGPVQASLRHGVSELRAGQRYTIGIIFHDAT
ncbi:Uncharacterized protein conserved in bacteria (DUF2086) [Bordetella pertussis]|uniref:Fe2OG dioxygenase domain-containing protein n=19 Tax=Bordetella pertussis TaxID=520 RepID=Q7W027_BORPE|nr:2OG-Fe(II) oxygenase [Bordetella pertussis]ETH38403.1 damaged DNA methylation oxygenase [Bordetella pertussis H918]ETH46514.1 damaged DNA methylation oxygenase [Bordetella pertussis H921]ETH73272.1 damaged DNA methylation oxygenase [Bordetella pertussis STO1-CHLA-0011]ETH86426.1 damaged DNA methylation oxygenase [Bordetella pertussis STO1-CHOC-0018]ETH91012.1 damaged DNA methylation oxygenase [Bordetella pertussis STO1-CHOC-0019]KCV19999.1 damaged DNA methylation oxygenase [Bordetella pert